MLHSEINVECTFVHFVKQKLQMGCKKCLFDACQYRCQLIGKVGLLTVLVTIFKILRGPSRSTRIGRS